MVLPLKTPPPKGRDGSTLLTTTFAYLCHDHLLDLGLPLLFRRIPVFASAWLNSLATETGMPTFLANFGSCAAAAMSRACLTDFEGMAILLQKTKHSIRQKNAPRKRGQWEPFCQTYSFLPKQEQS